MKVVGTTLYLSAKYLPKNQSKSKSPKVVGTGPNDLSNTQWNIDKGFRIGLPSYVTVAIVLFVSEKNCGTVADVTYTSIVL